MSKRLGYVPALDGIRGIAIIGVIARHYWNFPRGGGAGVELFFVLSGFLITTLLLDEHTETGTIKLRSFYVRRARRLFPALAVFLAVYLAVGVATGDRTAPHAVLAAGFYTGNFASAFWPHTVTGSPVGPLWSLAEEEQFYLLWPALLIALLYRRVNPRWIIATAALLIAAVTVWRVVLYMGGADDQRIRTGPESGSGGLLVGVALAFLLAQYGRKQRPHTALVAGWVFAFMVYLGLISAVSATFVELASAGLVAAAAAGAAWLSWEPLAWVGRISYSLYLWHVLVLHWTHGRTIPALVLSIGIAWLSYRFIEQPFRRRRAKPMQLTPNTETT